MKKIAITLLVIISVSSSFGQQNNTANKSLNELRLEIHKAARETYKKEFCETSTLENYVIRGGKLGSECLVILYTDSDAVGAVQQTRDGTLVSVILSHMHSASSNLIFIEKNAKDSALADGENIEKGIFEKVGTYQYVAVNGLTKTIHKLKRYDNDILNGYDFDKYKKDFPYAYNVLYEMIDKSLNFVNNDPKLKDLPDKYNKKFCRPAVLGVYVTYGGKLENGCIITMGTQGIPVMSQHKDGTFISANTNNRFTVMFIEKNKKDASLIDKEITEGGVFEVIGNMQYTTTIGTIKTIKKLKRLE